MKLYKLALVLMMGLTAFTSCNDKLDLVDPNRQTTGTYGNTEADLQECIVGAYKRIRMEGSFARVGYGYDIARGDEVWCSSQQWNYLDLDNYNTPVTNEETMWPWREWYYTLNACNFIITHVENMSNPSENVMKIKGEALFLRGLCYYNLAGYYQNPILITDYSQYSTLEGLYGTNNTYDEVLDQVETDFKEAMTLLPSRNAGGEWAKGRATCGAAAGFYARTLMQRHKYQDALDVLRDIMNSKYGAYKLMDNYGDNFREGAAYENNDESLFEVQFMDYGTQGTDDEWTPVNTSINATQGHAIESNFASSCIGGWADLAATNWLYDLFKSERTVTGRLDPRLYWTIATYEVDWNNFEAGNVYYGETMAPDGSTAKSGHPKDENGKEIKTKNLPLTTHTNGGLPIAKWTNCRTNIYKDVVTGLRCGINLRIMRYSDVLLRAAECINEISGPTQEAIDLINKVRTRANLPGLNYDDFAGNADKLFEQIANVERPKEFGCEFGRGFDLIRWGWFHDSSRLLQLKEHNAFRVHDNSPYNATIISPKTPVKYADKDTDKEIKSGFDTYVAGHEFLPISQGTMNANPNLKGNSANYNTDNAEYFHKNGWKIHPVVK